MSFNYQMNASLVGPGLTAERTGIFDIDYSGRASGISTLYTLAADSTLHGQGTGANFGSTVASKISTLQGSTCTWDSNFSYNTASNITINSANITTWSTAGRVCLVWANYSTSASRDLATQIINAGGRVVSLVFGSINFTSGAYSISEVQNMPSTYQILSSTGQSNLPTPTTMTVQNVAGFADIANQSFTASNYFASTTPSLSQASATVFLRDGASTPWGAYYKAGSVGHAMIMLWPGSAYGFSSVPENSAIFTDIVARAARAIT